MPALVSHLRDWVAQMAQQGQTQQDRLLASQAQFHGEVQRVYAELAASVDRSLKASLAEGVRLAGAAIEPAVQATMAGLAQESATLREVLADAVQQQLDGATARLDQTTTRWLAQQREGHEALVQHTRQAVSATVAGVERHATALLGGMAEAHDRFEASAALRERERMMQAEAHSRATLGEVARLVQAASEAPRAAAEVIAELRRTLSDSLARDNAVLDERNRLMTTLGSLLDAVNHASTEQRGAIDALVNATTDMLDRVGGRFADTVEAESRRLQSVAAQVSGSAAEVASLGEGFGLAVQLFSRASEQLTGQLQRIEGALGQSMARSDEQLAYYVAQAREIIDLTLGSQRQIVEDLQQMARAWAPAAERVSTAEPTAA
jgi:hypothetical protein